MKDQFISSGILLRELPEMSIVIQLISGNRAIEEVQKNKNQLFIGTMETAINFYRISKSII
jgi:hypothetical protein